MATIQLNDGLTISCAVLFIPAAAILTGMRFYTRRQQKAPLSMDDWLMIPAFILVMAMQVTMIVEVCKRMIGYADPNFKPGKADASSNLAFWPFELEQIPALSLIKLSILFFYRRIFNTGATPYINWSTIVMIVLVISWTVAYFFTFLFLCGKTPDDYWISAVAEKSHCVATQELHLAYSISDTILDIFVLFVAVPAIWGLQMSTSRKFAVTGIFGLGLITVAASITRMVIFISATALRYDPYLDFEYLITNCMYWSMLECGLGFIAANLIVVYSVIARSAIFRSIVRSFYSLRSLLPSSSRVTSSKGQSWGHSNGKGQWAAGEKTNMSASSAEYAGSQHREGSLHNYEVLVKKQFGNTVETV